MDHPTWQPLEKAKANESKAGAKLAIYLPAFATLIRLPVLSKLIKNSSIND